MIKINKDFQQRRKKLRKRQARSARKCNYRRRSDGQLARSSFSMNQDEPQFVLFATQHILFRKSNFINQDLRNINQEKCRSIFPIRKSIQK